MRRILYTSTEIREAIIQLFSSGQKRRIAIAAFVGEGAEAYLPKPNGLQLICWPKAGGTHPQTIRKLMKLGVQISFCDSLHMKVYYAEERGCVITSANLSTNALGGGDQKEIGILLAAEELNIDTVTSSLRLRPVTRQELRRLDRQDNLYMSKNPVRTGAKPVTFREWYDSEFRPEWKLVSVEKSTGPVSLRVEETLKAEYGVKRIQSGIKALPGMFSKGDWTLKFPLKGESPGRPTWMFVDFTVKVPRSDKVAYDPEYPYQVVQV